MRKEGISGQTLRPGESAGPYTFLPRLQVVASVVDQDSFSGFAPLQPQVRQSRPSPWVQVSRALWKHPAGESIVLSCLILRAPSTDLSVLLMVSAWPFLVTGSMTVRRMRQF